MPSYPLPWTHHPPIMVPKRETLTLLLTSYLVISLANELTPDRYRALRIGIQIESRPFSAADQLPSR